jgi:phosphate starvation-inducible membrane PsiE
MGGTAMLLIRLLQAHSEADSLVIAIDRLLFVLMVIEILHTVRVSFRSGTLVAEPFLVVGLIASIRRVLVITLESSQANQYGKWTPDSPAILHSTMLELLVLGGLILVMVISIFLLRRAGRRVGAD